MLSVQKVVTILFIFFGPTLQLKGWYDFVKLDPFTFQETTYKLI